MLKSHSLFICVLVILLLLVSCSLATAASSEPVYNTGLEFTGKYDEAEIGISGLTATYVQLEKPYSDVPRTFETWIWIDADWPLNKYPDGDPDDKRVGVIIANWAGWEADLGPREMSHTAALEVWSSGNPRFYWNNGEMNLIVSDIDFRTGEWLHYAVVRDETARRGTVTFYMNGQEIYTYILGAGEPVIPRDPPIIGGDYDYITPNNQWGFNGKIGELRVWTTARTAEEINNYMNVELTGDEEGLIGYWKFDEGEGNILHDSSPSGNHGTIIGAQWYIE